MISTEVTEEEVKSFIPKTIAPGNHVVKINGIRLRDGYQKDEKHVILDVETKPIEGFEGFLIDKDKPELGRHEGQTGQVKLQQFAFNNKEYVNGQWVESSKNTEKEPTKLLDERIVRAINRIFLEAGKKLSDIGKEFNTKEEMIDTLNKKNPFKDMWFEMAIGATEYFNKDNYKQYDLFLCPNEYGQKGIAKTNIKLESNELVETVKYDVNNPKHFRPAKEKIMTDDKGDIVLPEAPKIEQPQSDGLPF